MLYTYKTVKNVFCYIVKDRLTHSKKGNNPLSKGIVTIYIPNYQCVKLSNEVRCPLVLLKILLTKLSVYFSVL